MTASLEARGLRLVASAGTVVAVLIGLVALTPKTLSGLSGSLLGVGVGCLLASASLAIVCASPKRALEVEPTSVEAKLSDQFWRAKSEYARRSVARSQLKVWAPQPGLQRPAEPVAADGRGRSRGRSGHHERRGIGAGHRLIGIG